MATDGEVLGLLARGYCSVYVFEIHCSECGTIRTIVEVIGGHVEREQPCPVCRTPRRAIPLGYGFTRQSVPRFEIVYLTNRRLGTWNSVEYTAERFKRRQAFRQSFAAEERRFAGTH